MQVPWELTLLVTRRSSLSDVLTLNITPGPMGCPPTPFLVAAISCFFRKVAAELRFDPKDAAACWPLTNADHHYTACLFVLRQNFLLGEIQVELCLNCCVATLEQK